MKDEDVGVNSDEAFNLPYTFKNCAVSIHADLTLVELVNIRYIRTYRLDQTHQILLQLLFCSCY